MRAPSPTRSGTFRTSPGSAPRAPSCRAGPRNRGGLLAQDLAARVAGSCRSSTTSRTTRPRAAPPPRSGRGRAAPGTCTSEARRCALKENQNVASATAPATTPSAASTAAARRRRGSFPDSGGVDAFTSPRRRHSSAAAPSPPRRWRPRARCGRRRSGEGRRQVGTHGGDRLRQTVRELHRSVAPPCGRAAPARTGLPR